MNSLHFISLTFAISLAGFACIYFIPAARSPESATGLPFWLIMVWGPSLAALLLSAQNGQIVDLLARAVTISSVPPIVWLFVIAPLFLVLLMRPMAPSEVMPINIWLLLAWSGSI